MNPPNYLANLSIDDLFVQTYLVKYLGQTYSILALKEGSIY
jgi:hypothetical protein